MELSNTQHMASGMQFLKQQLCCRGGCLGIGDQALSMAVQRLVHTSSKGLGQQRVCRRTYATVGGVDGDDDAGSRRNTKEGQKDTGNTELDHKILKLIHAYPQSATATPYEVLNIASSDKNSVSGADLKKRFFQLAKIYHPDSSSAHGYPLERGRQSPALTDETKDARFKRVLSAYNLLKNPIAKANYDRYNVGWNDFSNLRTNANMYSPSSSEYRNFSGSNFYRSNFTSYETGTWEDRYRYGYESAYGFHNDQSWSSSKTGDMKEELLKNKKTIFLSFVLTIAVYGALQLTHLYLYDDVIGEHYNESLSASSVNVHEKSEDDLFHAYTNYGLGDTKEDRINRFLWWRKLTMAFSLADVKEVLDHLYKRGIIENSEENTKLRQYDYEARKD